MIVLAEPWALQRHQDVIGRLSFGKRLPGAVYVLDGEGLPIPPELGTVISKLREKLEIGAEFNVLKLSTDRLRISFLNYPDFFSDPHPGCANPFWSARRMIVQWRKARLGEYRGLRRH
jgi:hypothetical protein